jgi:hypothetical protein
VTEQSVDFTGYVALSHGKDYDFFAAIAGFHNRFDVPPLYRPRGLPSVLSPRVREHMTNFFDEDWVGQGWLTLSEIEAALAHMGLSAERLSLAVRVVLNCMACLARELGDPRVRLVFALDG